MITNIANQNLTGEANEIIKKISMKSFGVSLDEAIEKSHVESETDVLAELRSNIAELEDVSLRLGFMMREVSYLIRKH